MEFQYPRTNKKCKHSWDCLISSIPFLKAKTTCFQLRHLVMLHVTRVSHGNGLNVMTKPSKMWSDLCHLTAYQFIMTWRKHFYLPVMLYHVALGLSWVICRTMDMKLQWPTTTAELLSVTERIYAWNNKDVLVVVFGVKKVRDCVHGCKFTVVTDHKTLLVVFSKNRPILQIISPYMFCGSLPSPHMTVILNTTLESW